MYEWLVFLQFFLYLTNNSSVLLREGHSQGSIIGLIGFIADLQQTIGNVVELLGYFEPLSLGLDEGVLDIVC